MTSNANSVNIKERDYHHGDLRAALLSAGMAALDVAPVEALSLRALAREAGVSATAVYRHFPDKDALLAALALAALDRMGRDQQAAADAVPASAGPEAAFCATGAAYVRFAIQHPALFRLIWRTAPAGDVLSGPIESAEVAMQCLRRSVAAVLPTGASPQQQRDLALRCWALVHGLAMLVLEGQVQMDDADIDRVIGGMIPQLRNN
jgi:AcrR family transcriptional regulator